MGIPRKVEEAARLADELHQKAYGQQSESGEAEKPTEPAAEPEQPKVETQPEPQAAEQEPAPAPEPEHKEEDVEYWKNRFAVLYGKYNAEVPALHAELRNEREARRQMEQRMQLLEQQPQQPQQQDAAYDPDIVETYGEDFVRAVEKIARKNTPQPAQNAGLEDEVKQLRQMAESATRAEFFRELTHLSPSWVKLNTDPGFLSWLEEVNPLTGRPRKMDFNQAVATNNPGVAASYFNTFLPPTKPSSGQREQQSLQQHIAPSTSRVSNAPAGKKTWSQNDIANFYQRVRRGEIKPQDAQRIEQDIWAAMSEGRMIA